MLVLFAFGWLGWLDDPPVGQTLQSYALFVMLGCLFLGLILDILLKLLAYWQRRRIAAHTRAERKGRQQRQATNRHHQRQRADPRQQPEHTEHPSGAVDSELPMASYASQIVQRFREREAYWQNRERQWHAVLDAANDDLAAKREQITQLEAQLAAVQAQRLPMITVETVATASTILIVGSRGSGKTTLLQAILRERVGFLCVFDPHSAVAKWPTTALVCGGGRNFRDVYEKLVWLYSLMDRRAKEQAQKREGECQFRPISMIADEWGAILKHVPVKRDDMSPSDMVSAMLKEGRKYKIGFVAGAHGDTIASIGAKGDREAFINSFDWVIYTGAFVAEKLRGYPHILREIPWAVNADTIRFPLIAVAYQPTTRSISLLDLRGITQRLAHDPTPTADDLVDLTIPVGDPQPSAAAIAPTTPQPQRQRLNISAAERQTIITAALAEIALAAEQNRMPSKGAVCRAAFDGRDTGTSRQKVVQVIEEANLADHFVAATSLTSPLRPQSA